MKTSSCCSRTFFPSFQKNSKFNFLFLGLFQRAVARLVIYWANKRKKSQSAAASDNDDERTRKLVSCQQLTELAPEWMYGSVRFMYLLILAYIHECERELWEEEKGQISFWMLASYPIVLCVPLWWKKWICCYTKILKIDIVECSYVRDVSLARFSLFFLWILLNQNHFHVNEALQGRLLLMLWWHILLRSF